MNVVSPHDAGFPHYKMRCKPEIRVEDNGLLQQFSVRLCSTSSLPGIRDGNKNLRFKTLRATETGGYIAQGGNIKIHMQLESHLDCKYVPCP
jgi:hypothetical protein